tara:strand:+ start:9517 stop:10104 length:588 start_codon:yes stop_codon:yes gene_type:complete
MASLRDDTSNMVYTNKTSNLDRYSKSFIVEEIKRFGLYKKNPYNIKCDTLLDIACGTGVFSIEFAKFYKVTGEDIALEAIKRANIENNDKNITYVYTDCLEKTSKHDIVFCRGPSFFIKNHIKSDTFKKFLDHLMNRCNKLFVFGMKNTENNPRAVYHSENDIKEIFSRYGEFLLNKQIGNQLFVVIKKTNNDIL